MAFLGDFGAAVAEADPDSERDTFKFFGEEFEVVAEAPPMLQFQIAAVLSGKVDETEGAAAMWQAFRMSLDEQRAPWEGEGPDTRPAPKLQFARFYELAVNRRATLESLMELSFTLFQGGGSGPTKQVSDSSVGLSNTLPSSSISSTHPALAHLRPVSEVLAG